MMHSLLIPQWREVPLNLCNAARLGSFMRSLYFGTIVLLSAFSAPAHAQLDRVTATRLCWREAGLALNQNMPPDRAPAVEACINSKMTGTDKPQTFIKGADDARNHPGCKIVRLTNDRSLVVGSDRRIVTVGGNCDALRASGQQTVSGRIQGGNAVRLGNGTVCTIISLDEAARCSGPVG